MFDVVLDATTEVTKLEAQLAEARANLAKKEALTPAQRLAEAIHEAKGGTDGHPDCYWRGEFAYNETPEGFHAWEHERFLGKAEKVLALVNNDLAAALKIVGIITRDDTYFD
jgi:hypothetical protein